MRAWVDKKATGVDVDLSAAKGWSSSPSAGLVMMSARALKGD
jgi:aspartate aminotransferase-like enzyme